VERSGTPGKKRLRESPEGAKDIFIKLFRPFRAPNNTNSYQGFALLTPGYYLIAASRLKKVNGIDR
jgi:hypothetical protein